MEKQETKRSTQVNKSLHLLFGQVANEMLAQGLERRTVLNDLKDYSCPVDAQFIKDIYKSILYTQTGLKSTTDATNAQIKTVYETFQKFLAENYKLNAEWPSIETLFMNDWYGDN